MLKWISQISLISYILDYSITKRDRDYYKIQELFYYKIGQFYYKKRQLLQSLTVLLQTVAVIAKYDVHYKMRQYKSIKKNKGSHEKCVLMTLYSVAFREATLLQVYFSLKRLS